MNIPGLGELTRNSWGEYQSDPIAVRVLRGEKCRFIVDEYNDDPDKEAFHVAIANFLGLSESTLKDAAPHVFQYYKDYEDNWKSCDDHFKPITSPDGVWDHVRFGNEPRVSRRGHGDKGIY